MYQLVFLIHAQAAKSIQSVYMTWRSLFNNLLFIGIIDWGVVELKLLTKTKKTDINAPKLLELSS